MPRLTGLYCCSLYFKYPVFRACLSVFNSMDIMYEGVVASGSLRSWLVMGDGN